MGKKRKTFSGKEKATIGLEALRERQTLREIAQKYEVHPTQVSAWKKEAQEHLGDLFGDKRRQQQEDAEPGQLIERLYQQIGQLQVELNWLKKKLGSREVNGLRGLIDPGMDGLSLSRQCALLGLSRSSYYYTPPVEESAFNLMRMRLMDERYLKTPFYGVG